MFCYSVRKQIAAMIAALGGVDMIVFTGGIGENDTEVRDAICAGLSWAGIGQIRVIGTQEDEQIARHTYALAPRAKTSSP
jgi:acetate kinase